MAPADNTPNFDAMSPEEIMAWMEALAKRQGANEGFTSSMDVEVPEIDPDTVAIDEPGYVPYGKDPKKWAEEEAARKAALASQPKPAPAQPKPVAPPPAPAPVQPAAPPPVAAQPPVPATPPPAAPVQPPPVEHWPPAQPAAQMPPPAPKPAAPEPASLSGLSWLESLAADQSADLPELDFSALSAEITPPTAPSSTGAVNPMDWLESLTQQGQEEETQTSEPQPVEAVDPFAGNVDPMSWLESIARRQGVKNEELLTEANLDVPSANAGQIDGPGYTPYSFDTLGLTGRQPEESQPVEIVPEVVSEEPAALEDPSAWLDSLASSQGFAPEVPRSAAREESPAADDVGAALARGEVVPPDLMERWMSRQLELGAMREEPEAEYDPDAPAVPADIPDWLMEQVGSAVPPEPEDQPKPEQPPLVDIITSPPPVADIPDWLKDEPAVESDLDNIFAVSAEAPVMTPAEPEMDSRDSWAEALEYERQHDASALPDWYVQNINDPARRAVVDRVSGDVPQSLEAATFEPETEVAPGQPEAVPDWLQGMVSGTASEPAAPAEEMPDWLRAEVTVQPSPAAAEVIAEPNEEIPDWLRSVDVDEVPDWLKETLAPSEPAAVIPPPPAPAPLPTPILVQPVVSQPIAPPPAPVVQAPISPVPVPVALQGIDAAAVLRDARASIGGNDIDGGLKHYETLVRANVELESVSTDLTKLIEKVKSNAALFRVLGDSLMRQGKLQAALDTYRKALNQL